MKNFLNIVLFPFRMIATVLSFVLKSFASVLNVFAILVQIGFGVLFILTLYTFIQGFTTGDAAWTDLLEAILWGILALVARSLPNFIFEVCDLLDRIGLQS